MRRYRVLPRAQSAVLVLYVIVGATVCLALLHEPRWVWEVSGACLAAGLVVGTVTKPLRRDGEPTSVTSSGLGTGVGMVIAASSVALGISEVAKAASIFGALFLLLGFGLDNLTVAYFLERRRQRR